MGEEDELEQLLEEIPYATSPLNLQQNHSKKTSNGTKINDDDQSSNLFKYQTCVSPVSGFSLPSDGSSSGFLSNSHDPSSPPFLDEISYHGNSYYNPGVLSPVFNVSDNSFGNVRYDNLVSQFSLSDRMSRFVIGDERENFSSDSNRFQSLNRCISGAKYDTFGYPARVFPDNPLTDPSGFQFPNHFNNGVSRYNMDNFDNGGRVLSENLSPYLNGFQFGDRSAYGAGSISEGNHRNFDYNGADFSNYGFSQSSGVRAPSCQSRESHSAFLDPVNFPCSPYNMPHGITNHTYLDCSTNQLSSALLGAQLNRMNMNDDMSGLNNIYNTPRNVINGKTRGVSNLRSAREGFGVSSNRDESLILREEGLNFVNKKDFERLRGYNCKGPSPLHDIGLENPSEKSSHLRRCISLIPPPKYESLGEIRGYIHMIAKDQDGCRFLQRIFEEGDPQDIQMVFNEIIGHVVELMVDPFGNYLMQKLLEVCNEEQRMQILLRLTEKPGQLIGISLNTHGTRVVQKLIETLKTRQHVSLVISALEPGFLTLIKDLNGNHVIKQCLQSLSHDDNKFIFGAASKYCVEVAKHQHGCCVLQCCISLLTGKHRENLVKEISANGILLAEDEYGNFVIQYILDLEIRSAKSSLLSQFEGNYVHLSSQKFSSHVVEKCLTVFDNNLRSKIIQELLSAPHFTQLLQHPFANYVIGKALKATEGSHLHNVLFEAIQCHESILRNCPYSKKLYIAVKQYRENSVKQYRENSSFRKCPPSRNF